MYKNILVPMALDHGIGAQSLEVARALLSEGGTISAVHIYEPPQGTVSAYLDEALVHEAFERTKADLEARVRDLPGIEAIISKGHSGRGIVVVASEIGADCIVIGSHKPGLIDYLLGSTAARVVRHAHCAVHVVRA